MSARVGGWPRPGPTVTTAMLLPRSIAAVSRAAGKADSGDPSLDAAGEATSASTPAGAASAAGPAGGAAGTPGSAAGWSGSMSVVKEMGAPREWRRREDPGYGRGLGREVRGSVGGGQGERTEENLLPAVRDRDGVCRRFDGVKEARRSRLR